MNNLQKIDESNSKLNAIYFIGSALTQKNHIIEIITPKSVDKIKAILSKNELLNVIETSVNQKFREFFKKYLEQLSE